jgi:hypothetical protein
MTNSCIYLHSEKNSGKSGATEHEYKLLYNIENSLNRLYANNSEPAKVSDHLNYNCHVTLCNKAYIHFEYVRYSKNIHNIIMISA